jgi:AraC-like DNA-binding protein
MKRFNPADHASDQHLRVNDVAKRLGVSDDTVRRIFGQRQGVRLLPKRSDRAKRPYRVMLISESLYREVCVEMFKP